jgi:hypothetical protein
LFSREADAMGVDQAYLELSKLIQARADAELHARVMAQYRVLNAMDPPAGSAFSTAELSIAALPVIMLLSIKWVDDDTRAAIKNENAASGFSHGVIMWLLDWNWHQVVDLFARHALLRIYQRPDFDKLWAESYNLGLRTGFEYGTKLDPDLGKQYLRAARKLSGAKPGDWNRDDQISYVIALAAAFRKTFMGPDWRP